MDDGSPLEHKAESDIVLRRTFHIDPSGRMLVAAHVIKMTAREGAGFRDVAAGVAMFRIAPDGRLRFVRSYVIEVGSESLFWMGMVG